MCDAAENGERNMGYDIAGEAQGVYKRFFGTVTASEFMASIAKLRGDILFDQVRYSINGFLSVARYDVSEADVRKFVAFGKGAALTYPDVRIAAITSDEKNIGLLRLYAAPRMSPFPLEVFSTLAEARRWSDSRSV